MSWHFHYRSEVFIAKCEEPVLISYFPLTMFSSPHTRYGCCVETGSCKGRWLYTSHHGRAFNGFHVDTCLIFTLVSNFFRVAILTLFVDWNHGGFITNSRWSWLDVRAGIALSLLSLSHQFLHISLWPCSLSPCTCSTILCTLISKIVRLSMTLSYTKTVFSSCSLFTSLCMEHNLEACVR